MGFFFTLVFLVLSYIRIFDLIPELAPYRIMLWISSIALVTSLPAFVTNLSYLVRAPQTYLLVALATIAAISRIAQGWLGGGLAALVDFSPSITIFFLILVNVTSLKRVKIFLRVWVLAALTLLIMGLTAYRTGFMRDVFVLTQNEEADETQSLPSMSLDSEGMPRAGIVRLRGLGFLNDPNDLGQAFVMMLPFLALAWRRQAFLTNVLLVVFPGLLLVYGIYLTRSRGALMALVVFTFLLGSRRWGVLRAGIVSLVPLVALTAMNMSGGRGMSLSDESNAGRVDAWSAGLAMLKASPVLGRGYNQFTEDNPLTAHNSFVLCFAELGISGYLVWMALLVITVMGLSAVINIVTTDRDQADDARLASALKLSLLCFLTAAFFLSRTYIPTLYALLALSTALLRLSSETSLAFEPPSLGVWGSRSVAFAMASIVLVYLIVRFRSIVT